MSDCVECRGTGVTKRGVCKCDAAEEFLRQGDGSTRAWFRPAFAARAFRAVPHELRDSYERVRVGLGLAGGELADRGAGVGEPPPATPTLERVPEVVPEARDPGVENELRLLRENVELRRQVELLQQAEGAKP